MDEKFARLRTHERNIDRYQRLLNTKLNDIETQFLERRLSEEHFWLKMLGGAGHIPTNGPDLKGTWEE
jgi:hypothetical protein